MNGGPDLPSHASSSYPFDEKRHRSHPSAWTRPIYLAIPGVHTRRLRVPVPNVSLHHLRMGRRRRGPFIVLLCLVAFVCVILFSRGGSRGWSETVKEYTTGEPSTLVFRREDLQRIWKWEIASGHYPSRATIPKQIGLKSPPTNPALPHRPRRIKPLSNFQPPAGVDVDMETLGAGPKRVYLDIQSLPPNVAYPPRPVPGSVADMDEILRHCDFSDGKYVRDCLEVLRIGGGLDNGDRLRKGDLDDMKYIYKEKADKAVASAHDQDDGDDDDLGALQHPLGTEVDDLDPEAGLTKKRGADWESHMSLPAPLTHRPAASLPTPCDPENPRVFHMFWTGPFTDKPYSALLSFLYTQNTGIHHARWPADSEVCRPQFWLWINPGPAAAVPNPSAVRDMYKQLKMNPWAAPFLHPRFKDVIHFKLWNTTEQLDGIPEIKDEWRAMEETLFNSGGHVIKVKKPEAKPASTANSTNSEGGETTDDDDMLNRLGSKSSSSYDRMSVILSDMARFVLCHRFGGIYLDADTIFLRDWEELWGWKGAFAYRWSRLPDYNTAVLRMNKGSALGSFLFRTALRNGLDFHPMTVSKYTADAHVEGLLLRLPDALFDSAWLNTENYQRDRPPQPYFTEFADFFDTPAQNSAAPQALGVGGFFRGAYSYHFHNFWWKPFDPTRNWPDLGPRFKSGEDVARAALAKEKKENDQAIPPHQHLSDAAEDEEEEVLAEEPDKRDLDWSTVLKRTFEAYIRGERPNMYGEWIHW
ncbi:glycosyltransferase family 32 protein [Crucibulum laeve]|uniref:Glycosyltransferase family 32 protein n=1 Tax=Crucibulum laeve TaxID=68775 RepID=A0A5C3LF51_9AGAR|nr:glycosyltransferase family 32 protein [Crucibulum laeve]